MSALLVALAPSARRSDLGGLARRLSLCGLGPFLEDVGGLEQRGAHGLGVLHGQVAKDLCQLPAKTCDHTGDVLDFDARRDHVLPWREAQGAV